MQTPLLARSRGMNRRSSIPRASTLLSSCAACAGGCQGRKGEDDSIWRLEVLTSARTARRVEHAGEIWRGMAVGS